MKFKQNIFVGHGKRKSNLGLLLKAGMFGLGVVALTHLGMSCTNGSLNVKNPKTSSSLVERVKKSCPPITKRKGSVEGRYQRTCRWDEIIKATEQKYNLEKGVIAGLIMQESYGDPSQLNSTNDGGAGLMQFQPGTARKWGLKIYGHSKKSGRDLKHGKKLRALAERLNYDFGKLTKFDDRFNPQKCIDAAGRYLANLQKEWGTLDRALSAYNQGRPAKCPECTNHVRLVRKYQGVYNGHK